MVFRSPHPDVSIPDAPRGDVVLAAALIAAAGLPITLITTDDAPGVASLASIARDADPPPVTIVPGEDVNLMQIDALEDRDLRAFVGVLPFFHIYGMVVIMNFALMRGATVVSMPRLDLETFLKVLQEWPIALAHIVPPVAVALAKHPLVDQYTFPHLRWLFSGAAPLGEELTDGVRQRLGVTIRQGYGMTEASPASHYTLPGADRDGTVGPLVPNTEGRIVHPVNGRDLGVGEPGKVWVRGPQVMKGYLNNPSRPPRRSTPTAGCTRATSAWWTPTAI
jgi:acyl-CoA synthetase (AMP-forming)/AMP-acid ligase II